jgi:hypothetical protein
MEHLSLRKKWNKFDIKKNSKQVQFKQHDAHNQEIEDLVECDVVMLDVDVSITFQMRWNMFHMLCIKFQTSFMIFQK